jgi:periplasmic copper chaperone A
MKTELLNRALLSILLTTLVFAGCQSDNQDNSRSGLIDGEGIAVEGQWARPGNEGRMSAGYFLISNFEEEPDTLIGVSSNVAQLTEIHESYEQEEGMMGMRERPVVVIPPKSTIRFEPGGLHVMFIQLTKPLIEEETFDLTLHFAKQGDIVVSMQVRS